MIGGKQMRSISINASRRLAAEPKVRGVTIGRRTKGEGALP